MKKLLIIIGVTIGLNISIVAGPIHDAATTGDLATVQAELDKGVNVDLKDDTTKITPLYRAVQNGHKQIVELLITRGADLEAKNYFRRASSRATNGTTAVFAALNNKEIMTLLIIAGADLNVKTLSYKETIMHILASRDESESNLEIIELVINSGVDVNAMTVAYTTTPKTTVSQGMGTPTDIALSNQNFVLAELLQKHGGKTTGEVIESLQNETEELEKLISEKHKADTTNPTDEWPRKMWEIEIGEGVSVGQTRQGLGKSLLVTVNLQGTSKLYWISKSGLSYEVYRNSRFLKSRTIYLDNKNFVYYKELSDGNLTICRLHRKENGQVTEQFFNKTSITREGGTAKAETLNSSPFHTVQVSWEGSKVTAWDFTPPSSSAPAPDGGNNGGNETANSRLIIKTSGPDIALATDGKLGAAELQKSNDLRSWRRLGDVPKEAAEVLVTPRESGNEFYRLKKK